MFKTSSIKFPNMIDPARNILNVTEDGNSVVNRTRLLILTEPTELYNEPEFGVGLRQYLWQYNSSAVRGIIQDKIRKQLDLWEPCAISEDTEFSDGLLFTDGVTAPTVQDPSDLKLTVGIRTKFGEDVTVNLSKQS